MNEENRAAHPLGEAVVILKELSEQNKVYISLSPPFELSFVIDRHVLGERLQKSDLDRDSFNIQSERISRLLLIVLQDDQDTFIEATKQRKEKEGEPPLDKEALLRDLSIVQNALFTEHLKGRYDLKRSSKAASFTGIDWDVKEKVRDSKLDKISFPYATCRISFQREFEGSPLTFIGGKAFDAVQINFCTDDIDHLIGVFTKIRQDLGEVQADMQRRAV